MNIQQGQAVGSQEGTNKRQLRHGFKAIITILLTTGFVLYRTLLPKSDVLCIIDAYQDATLAANRQLVLDSASSAFEGNSNQLSLSGQAFIGTGQVLMDLWILIFGLIWLVKVKNVRGFGSIACFFLTRSLIFLNVQLFPFPDNLVWRSPGFFSFTVPYDHTRDFFYSGHTGTLTTIFLEMAILGLKLPASFAFLSMLFMMNMLLITRVHYVADVIGGLLFAIWYHRTATRVVLYIDKALSFPFYVGHWIYENKIKPHCIETESTDSGNEQRQGQPQSGKDSNRQGNHRQIEYQNELIEIESRKSAQHLKQ